MRAMGYRSAAAAMGIVFCFLTGCSQACAPPSANTSTLLVVNGIDGPGPWYNSMIDGLREADAADRVEMFGWGAPLMIWPNLFFPVLHTSAEQRLADRIVEYRRQSPDGRITLMGHSAGCGVIINALQRLPGGTKVDTVVLLAPCVGEHHDLSSALNHVNGMMHVFYSDRDDLLLSTALTGTYDNAWNGAAGRQGFTNTSGLLPALQARLRQHAYDPAWQKLGYGGGHFGFRDPRFVAAVLAPLAASRDRVTAGGKSTRHSDRFRTLPDAPPGG